MWAWSATGSHESADAYAADSEKVPNHYKRKKVYSVTFHTTEARWRLSNNTTSLQTGTVEALALVVARDSRHVNTLRQTR